MTAKVVSPPRSAKNKKRVLRPIPKIDKQLIANGAHVTAKLKEARRVAQSGAAAGAMIIMLDPEGGWYVDIAGQLVYDEETRILIASRIFGACLLA